MRMSIPVAALLLAVLTAGGAVAQQTPKANSAFDGNPVAEPDKLGVKGTWRATKLIGIPIYNEERQKIGQIHDLIMNAKGGRIIVAVIDVSHFLEIKERYIAAPLEQLAFSELSLRASEADAKDRQEGKTMSPNDLRVVRIATQLDWAPNHAILKDSLTDKLKAMPAFSYQDAQAR
jgi:sporulation protein YlmC with PRC-barrel domain